MRYSRSDKKFNIKVWLHSQNKDIFRANCLKHHLSMMFVGEKYVTTVLDKLSDTELSNVIEAHLDAYIFMNTKKDGYEPIGIRVTNNYWQKLAFFAVIYKTSIAKITSCLFSYALENYSLVRAEEKYGLHFKTDIKKLRSKNHYDIQDRISDHD